MRVETPARTERVNILLRALVAPSMAYRLYTEPHRSNLNGVERLPRLVKLGIAALLRRGRGIRRRDGGKCCSPKLLEFDCRSRPGGARLIAPWLNGLRQDCGPDCPCPTTVGAWDAAELGYQHFLSPSTLWVFGTELQVHLRECHIEIPFRATFCVGF